MSQEDRGKLGVVEKRLPGVPKYYYWGKNPKNILTYYREQAKMAAEAYSKEHPVLFANDAQRRFYRIMLALRIAKVVGVLAFGLLVYHFAG
ncbi:MAG: hypothetical protein QW514_02310 [Thermoprotei archaeon]